MDLALLNVSEAASRGAELNLRHPVSGEELRTDDGRPITIRLLGADAPEYRQRVRQTANQNLQKRRKQIASVEQLEEQAAALLAAVTVSWSGVVLNGAEVEFSHEAAKSLYLEHPWVREQVDEFVSDRANFLN